MDPQILKNKTKVSTIFNIRFEKEQLHPDYEIRHAPENTIGETGLLPVFHIFKRGDVTPLLRARWDQNKEVIDIDLLGNIYDKTSFIREIHGHIGHHPQKVSHDPRIFKVDIRLKNVPIYSADVSFNVGWQATLTTTAHGSVQIDINNTTQHN